MTSFQLKQEAFYAFDVPVTSPLHVAVMDELCDTVINGEPAEEFILVFKARMGFFIALKTAKEFFAGVFALGDTITLNYRNTTTTYRCPADLEKVISADAVSHFDETFAGTYTLTLPDLSNITTSMN